MFYQRILGKFWQGHLITNQPITKVVKAGNMEDSTLLGEFYIAYHLQALN